MNLLFRVVDAAYCTSSHHRMALDALTLLSGPEAYLRRNLFLRWHEVYLKGSKAPDTEFKDFRNHVLHVSENLWGGAPQAARQWYERTVDELKRENWDQAAYAAGVLSHYVTDPFQPFHTGSSEKETHYHRAVEWSVAKSFPRLRERIARMGGYPKIELTDGRDWLEETILAGAERAHQDYSLPFERFDLERGSRHPEEGLDEALSTSFATLVAQATATFAAILDRACEESRAIPPDGEIPLATVLATLKVPIAWVTKKLVEHEEQRTVLAIYDEVRRTGTLTRYLPEECHALDMLHAEERLAQMPLSRFASGRNATPEPQATSDARKPTPPREARETPPSPAAELRDRETPQERTVPERTASVQPPPAPSASVTMSYGPKPAAEHRHPPETKPAQESSRQRIDANPELRPLQSRPAIDPARASAPQPSKPTSAGPTTRPADGRDSKKEAVARSSSDERRPRPSIGEMPSMKPSSKPVSQESHRPANSSEAASNSGSAKRARWHLELHSPIVDAPSIGPKTAARFEQVGVRTVEEFLRQAPDRLAQRLDASHLSAGKLREMQAQAKLVLQVAGLRGHDAQFLVGAGYTEPDEIAAAPPEELLSDVLEYIDTPDGERALRSGSPPDLEEVRGWIESARKPRALSAAAA